MCEKHPESGGTVCGEFVCGTCYGENLLTEPLPRYKKQRPPQLDLRRGWSGKLEHIQTPYQQAEFERLGPL